MKKQLLLLFLLLARGIFAQQPEFSFKLYFEDAAGNKDTLTIRYDDNATDSIDTAFGEVNLINQAWNDSLDVRIGDLAYSHDNWFSTNGTLSDYIDSNSFLSKIQILQTPFNSPSCSFSLHSYFSGRVSIQVYTENYPVTVKWDSTLFNSGANYECRYFSSFFGRNDYTEYDGGDLSMLKGQESIVILNDSIYETWYQAHRYTPINHLSNGSKNISVLQFSFFPAPYLDLQQNGIDIHNVYPNPIQSGEILNIDYKGDFNIIDLNGKIVQKGRVDNNQIQLDPLQKGLYILNLGKEYNQQRTKLIIE